MGAVEIIQLTSGQSLNPRFWMAVAILITIYSGVRVFRLRPRPAKIAPRKKRARATEIVNQIHSKGFAVYQDPSEPNGDGYIVVGPSGVYALELKERNVFGSRTIEFGGNDKLILGGRIADSRPVKQAQAAAMKIGDGLKGVLHKGFAVRPLVVFANDWRIHRAPGEAEVAVLNEDELPQYLNGQASVLSQSDVAEISTCLDQFEFAAAC
ncbi:MAG TPA: nuclease-related domain-containing protein [Chthoniobacterales bacterium]|nr:nuclease-related domain-containing protein [Chthoniobacterales bacterium]